MSTVKRVYVEKKPDYAVKAKELHDEIKNYLNIDAEYVRVLVRYDIENLSEETYKKALVTVFSEPPIDMIYEGDNLPMADTDKVFSVEFLPGQFDQRADSAEQCVKLLNEDEDPIIKTATTYILSGNVTDEQLKAVMEYCINPVDSRCCSSRSFTSCAMMPPAAASRRRIWCSRHAMPSDMYRQRPRHGRGKNPIPVC